MVLTGTKGVFGKILQLNRLVKSDGEPSFAQQKVANRIERFKIEPSGILCGFVESD